ncbi:MAG: N-acetylmuramoyl-L-alanine amidase [Planctomycetes bacterium]|nr:N-acetylmuramoyl-L-alanine amidase [Planctomycetota bacterium]
MPKIMHDYGLSSSVSKELVKPAKTLPVIPKDWWPSSKFERKWIAIVIHHSGTKNGSLAIFDKWHKEGNHWEGVGYDFVIGNGTNTNNGEVEVTFRWNDQKVGAHCGGTYRNWANKEAIGICLVGNFNKTSPTGRQLASLVKLIRFLQSRYGISESRIYGHNTTPGARATDCPGKKFSMAKLKSTL